jgi:adenosylcobinamide-GDP ribazoletransferase
VRDDDSSKSKPLAQRMTPWRAGDRRAVRPGALPLAAPGRLAGRPGGAALVTLFAARYFLRRIGGYTGDCLGATQQVAELAFYLGLLCNFS